MEVDEMSMEKFLKETFKNEADPGALTMRMLRERYLAHANITSELTAEQRQKFAKAVDAAFTEAEEQSSPEKPEITPRKPAKKKARKSSSDDDFKPSKRGRDSPEPGESSEEEFKHSIKVRRSAPTPNKESSDDDEVLQPKPSSDEEFKPTTRKSIKEKSADATFYGSKKLNSSIENKNAAISLDKEIKSSPRNSKQKKKEVVPDSSSSDDELALSTVKKNLNKSKEGENELSDTLDEDLKPENVLEKSEEFNSTKLVDDKPIKEIEESPPEAGNDGESSSEGEPLSSLVKAKPNNSRKKTAGNTKSKTEKSNARRKPVKRRESSLSADEFKSVERSEAKEVDGGPFDSSDEEPLAGFAKKDSGVERETSKVASDSDSAENSDGGGRTDEKNTSARSKKKTKKTAKMSKTTGEDEVEKESKDSKKQEDDDPQIIRLKRYLRTAGVRIMYAKVFEGCKSKKARVEKLTSLLEDAGLKGSPTLEKCKKLRRKRETMREVAELDCSNILGNTEGRTRRLARNTRSKSSPSPPPPPREASPPSEPSDFSVKRVFSRLKGIVDSEESSGED